MGRSEKSKINIVYGVTFQCIYLILQLITSMTGIFIGTLVSIVIMTLSKLQIIYRRVFRMNIISGIENIFVYSLLMAAGLFFTHLFCKYSDAASWNPIVHFLANCIVAGIISISLAIIPYIQSKRFLYWLTHAHKIIVRVFRRK